ncbi:MAG: AAA family ATPase [Gammaproteobacteria bacterium]
MIIIICGTSSSGKSSVCEELKKKLGDSWLIFSTDGYLSMLGNKFLELHPENNKVTIPNDVCYAKKYNDGTFEIIPGELCSKLYLTIPSVLKLLSQQGFNIILDSFITTKDEFNSYKDLMKEFDPHFFYLYASENVIADREEKRGNRLKGSAIHWLKKFNFQVECDLLIDTEKLSKHQIGDLVLSKLKK